MSFYTFNQNNTGGTFSFRPDAKISHYVIIEASSADEANSRAEDIGLYFDGCDSDIDCSCCGDRWYPVYMDEASDVPEVYGVNVLEENISEDSIRWMDPNPEGYIHYLDGRVDEFWRP